MRAATLLKLSLLLFFSVAPAATRASNATVSPAVNCAVFSPDAFPAMQLYLAAQGGIETASYAVMTLVPDPDSQRLRREFPERRRMTEIARLLNHSFLIGAEGARRFALSYDVSAMNEAGRPVGQLTLTVLTRLPALLSQAEKNSAIAASRARLRAATIESESPPLMNLWLPLTAARGGLFAEADLHPLASVMIEHRDGAQEHALTIAFDPRALDVGEFLRLIQALVHGDQRVH